MTATCPSSKCLEQAAENHAKPTNPTLKNLSDLSGLLLDLEAVLHTKVDVVTERGLRDRIRDRVLREAVAL